MGPGMKGQDSLQLFDVGVLLQALSSNLKIGVLAVSSGGRRKYLHLDRATLRGVYTRKPRVTLQKVLYNHRTVDVAHLKAAAAELGEKRTDAEVARFLRDHDHVTPDALDRARRYQLIEEGLELFYWPNVGFEFHAGEEPAVIEKLFADGYQLVGDRVAVDSILINCTKITDDLAKFNSVTPSLRDVYELLIHSIDELEAKVPDPAHREFMLLIDGVRDMREVLRDMRMNRFEVLELFYSFHQAGLLRSKNGFELLMLAENRRNEFSPQKRARVLERVIELGGEGFDVLQPLARTYEELGRRRDAAGTYVKHAKNALRNDDTETALGSASRATLLVPDDPALRRFEIRVLERSGDQTKMAEAVGVLGDVLTEAGDVVGSRAAYRRAARLSPMYPAVWQRLGDAYTAEGAPGRGALCIRRAGDLHLDSEEFEAAEECYRASMALVPHAWSVRFRLVDALHRGGHSDMAVQELSDLVGLLDRGGAIEDDALRGAKLLEVEHSLLAVGGMASSASQHLGAAFLHAGAVESAERLFAASATALSDAKRHRTAIESFNELVELRPNDLAVRRAMARCHADMGDRNRALAQLRRAGARYEERGDWTGATETYEEMLDIDSSSLDAHRSLAMALHHAGEQTRAAEHFHRAALLHRANGRREEAVPFLREAVAMRPTDADLLAELCELLGAEDDEKRELLASLAALVELRMRAGQTARAAVALTRILSIDADFPTARDLLRAAATQLLNEAREPTHPMPGAATRKSSATS